MPTTVTDLLIQICKLGGVLWAAAFGVMALLTTFRDEQTQQVTRWGRVALLGITVSTLLAVGAQLLEYARAQDAQRTALQQLAENVERQQNILDDLDYVLREIDRQNHALAGVVITVALQFPEDHPMIKSYFNELMTLFDTIIQRYRDGRRWYEPGPPSLYVEGTTGPDGQVDRIWLPVPQDTFPKGAIGVTLSVGVYSELVSVNSLDLGLSVSDSESSPDLSFALNSSHLEAGRLHYFPSRRSFVFEFRVTPLSLRTTRSSMSIRDLEGKLLAVGILIPDEMTTSLVGLQFRLPSGVAVTIGSDAFEATSKSWPEVSFYTIVADLDQMGQWPLRNVLP